MARYYDLDKLSKLIEAKADTMLEGKGAMLYVAKWLNLLPTADVVEVKHGEWVLKHIGAGHHWECSGCGFKNAVMPRTEYCPHCGAKMDSQL